MTSHQYQIATQTQTRKTNRERVSECDVQGEGICICCIDVDFVRQTRVLRIDVLPTFLESKCELYNHPTTKQAATSRPADQQDQTNHHHNAQQQHKQQASQAKSRQSKSIVPEKSTSEWVIGLGWVALGAGSGRAEECQRMNQCAGMPSSSRAAVRIASFVVRGHQSVILLLSLCHSFTYIG